MKILSIGLLAGESFFMIFWLKFQGLACPLMGLYTRMYSILKNELIGAS